MDRKQRQLISNTFILGGTALYTEEPAPLWCYQSHY